MTRIASMTIAEKPHPVEVLPLDVIEKEKDEEKAKLAHDHVHGGMDHLLSMMGQPGSYQILIFLALASCMFPVVFNDLSTIFYTIHPSVSNCSLYDEPSDAVLYSNSSVSSTGFQLNQSSNYVTVVYGDSQACDRLEQVDYTSPEGQACWRTMKHQFDEPAVWTVVSEWNLICQRYWQVSFATTVYFLGVMTGSMTMGHLADRLGRLRCILACYVGYLPLGIALAFVQHYWLFLLLRFCIGFFIQGIQSVCFVLVMEYCSPRFREVAGGLEGLLGGLAVGVLGGIAYWAQNWRYIQICVTLPTLLALLKVLFLRESLRWQMVHGKIEEAKQSVLYILLWNKLSPVLSPSLDEQLKVMSDELCAEEELESHYTWLDCFRTPKMRRYTIFMSFMWFTVLFVYYGISFTINDLSGNLYVNIMAGAAVEVPVYIVTVYFMHRFGRKLPLLVFYGSCGVLCLLAAFVMSVFPAQELLRTVLVFAARFALAGTYTVVFVYGSELFPTILRNTAFGICICCHTFGGICCPQVLLLGKLLHEAIPFVVFGCCCLVSCALVMILPETLNRRMPDTIDQVEHARS